jgi:hypothetical protein
MKHTIQVKTFKELGELHQRKVETKALPFGTVTNSQGVSSALKTRPLFAVVDKGASSGSAKRENVHVKVGTMTVMETNIPLRAN